MTSTASMPAEFQKGFEAEALRWLRRRLLWCCGIFGAFLALTVIGTSIYAAMMVPDEARQPAWIAVALTVVTAAVFLAPMPYLLKARGVIPRSRLIWIVTAMVCAAGLLKLAQIPFMFKVQGAMPETETGLPAGAEWLLSMTVLHFLTSLLIPWTPREAIRPLIPVLILNAFGIAIFDNAPLLIKIGIILLMCVIAVPGTLVAWIRHTRFRNRFHLHALSGRFDELSQDLTAARRIHESILPRSVLTGPVRFDYRYEPMREIGGDYVHARITPDAATVVIIDVTGHGIGAALAVNRLHTELTHRLASDPGASPGSLLAMLNARLNVLAEHSMYATAICLRVDTAASTVRWASAGHPPAFVRSLDGALRSLESTAIVLGACGADDFDPDEQSAPFHSGDIAILYTDGVIESRNDHGKMLGIAGLERAIAAINPRQSQNPGGWSTHILAHVNTHRAGPAEDDTLIVEISRPI